MVRISTARLLLAALVVCAVLAFLLFARSAGSLCVLDQRHELAALPSEREAPALADWP